MKTLTFRPLRHDAKRGTIVVASYPQWRNVFTANYNPFFLTVVDQYAYMPHDRQVYNHQGQPLFFPVYDPNELPVFSSKGYYSAAKHYEENEAFIYRFEPTQYSPNPSYSYYGRGIDCDGVPTFSHLTLDHVAEQYSDMNQFEPLTVGMVLNWLGWFLMRLENATIKVKK